MADHFLGALKQIERRSDHNKVGFSGVLQERLDELAQSMIFSPMSDNDYLKVLELYYQKYNFEKNVEAKTFCLLRMQMVDLAKKNEKYRYLFPALQFSQDHDSKTQEFLEKKRSILKYFYDHFMRRLVIVFTLVTIIMMFFFVLALSMPFVSGVIVSLAIGAMVFVYGRYVWMKRSLDRYLKEIKGSVDATCARIDRWVCKKR